MNECHDNLSENPRARWVDVLPTTHEGKEVFFLRDPEGISEASLLVTRDALFIISLMDGTRSVREIQTEYTRVSGNLIYPEHVNSVIDALDKSFLLLNERYENYARRIKEDYDAAPHRKSFLAGKSYPDNQAELSRVVASMLEKGAQPTRQAEVKGIIAPHIDYARGGEVYGEIYKYLPDVDNLLLVILGTCHKFAPRVWNISLKDFETPLGKVKSAGRLGMLIREHPLLKDYVEEWPHRNEHSIELQLPIIQFMLGQRPFQILPILTGSLHEYVADGKRLEEDEVPALVEALKNILKEHDGPVVLIAAADLAHIGAQFGDARPLDPSTLQFSEQKDRELLELIAGVNGTGFFEAVKREGDRRRICGLAPIYFLLSLIDADEGHMIGYKQWSDGASSVSFAGAAFYRA